MRKAIEIVPSLLSADFAILAEEIRKVEQAGCRSLHLDVMDGHFVPNITIGPVVIEAIRRRTKLSLEAHLMIDEPGRYLNDFKAAGLNSVSIHREACCDFLQTIGEIKRLGMEAGIALSPETPPLSISDVVQEMDLILVMSVEPGFGGQFYLEGIEKKIMELRNLITKRQLDIPIEVDGGINPETAPIVVRAGATRLVAGHFVFTGDVVENIKKLRRSVESY